MLWIIKAAAQFKVKTAISSSFHLCLPHLWQMELLKFYDSWLQVGCEGRLNRSLDWVAAGARGVVVKKKDMKVEVDKEVDWVAGDSNKGFGWKWQERRWIELQLMHESRVVGCLGGGVAGSALTTQFDCSDLATMSTLPRKECCTCECCCSLFSYSL